MSVDFNRRFGFPSFLKTERGGEFFMGNDCSVFASYIPALPALP